MKLIMAALLAFVPLQLAADALPQGNAQFPKQDISEVRLGQLLFYDPILSGNKTVSCATCHHPHFGTGDGLSLGIGDGGTGLGPERKTNPKNNPEQRIPRNAPALFNLGNPAFSVLFHDGRLEVNQSEATGFRTPLGDDMEDGFDGVLSAQTMFPVLSPDEMAGHYSENDVAQAIRQGLFTGPGGAWDILSKRVAAIPEYSTQFEKVIGTNKNIHFTDISNAIAAFMAFEWRADDSPFDRHLRGDGTLTAKQMNGMTLFYGDAGCGSCHAGQFQTDHDFHAIGMVQIGPGKAARFERHQRDEGRRRVTGNAADTFAFRTPSLRNITHTAPYGHAGAFATLKAVIEHHNNPEKSFKNYDPAQAVLPEIEGAKDFTIVESANEVANILKANQLKPVKLSDQNVADIIAFLGALTDETAIKGRLGIPDNVPSGLPIER